MFARAPLFRQAAAAVAVAAITIVGLSLGPGHVARGTTPKPGPCARANALQKAGFLTEALAAYKADLGKRNCAIGGVKAVKKTLEAKSAEPNSAAADEFADAVAVIRRLEAEGFEADAREKVKQLVESYPNRTVPKDIRAIDQPVGWWRRQKGRAGPAVLMLAELAIVALGGLLVVLVTAKAPSALRWRFRRRYTVADVTGPVAADAAGQGEVLAAELARIAGEADAPVRRVQATEGNFTLPPALTDAYPQAGILAALLSVLDRVLPQRLMTISAVVLPVDAGRGVGVTATIAKRGGRQLPGSSRTIWESEFGPVDADGEVAERLGRLMLPVAVWLGYSPELVLGAVQHKPRRVLPDRRPEPVGVTMALGTTDWLSYAHFALAERAQRAGDTLAARRGYFTALDADLANIGARLNLAGLLLYRRPSDQKSETDDDRRWRLSFAEWLLEDDMDEPMQPADPRLHWRWLYLRAARSLAAAAITDGPKAPPARNASDEAATALDGSENGALPLIDKLLAAVTPEQRGPGAPRRGRAKRSEALGLAVEMRWPAWVLKSSIQLAQCKVLERDASDAEIEALAPDARKDENEDFNRGWWTANTLYNLACFYARAAGCRTAKHEAYAKKARDFLCDAIDRAAEPKLMLEMATCDRALDNVVTKNVRADLDELAGITAPYEADEHAGRALGMRIGAAITAALSDVEA